MLRRKFRKFILYPIISLFSLSIILAGCACLFLLNVHRYQNSIKKILSNNTGYVVDFTEINGSFNLRWQPTIVVSNLRLRNKDKQVYFLQVSNLKFSLSLRSFIKHELVVSQIKLSGLNLNVLYDKNQNIYINEELITNLKQKRKSTFNPEDFLLQLHEFDITDLNLVIHDDMHKLNPIRFWKVNFDLVNHIGSRHNIDLKTRFAKSELTASLKFQGEKFSEISNWQSGELVLYNHDTENHDIKIYAKIKNGQLDVLDTKFDSNARQMMALNSVLKGKSEISGAVKVLRESADLYVLKATDIVINTVSGPILNHASLSGNYTINKHGNLNLSEMDLTGISSFKFYQLTNMVNLSGKLENVNLSFDGPILKPTNIELHTNFKNIAINSTESSIPSIDNINGDLLLHKKSGLVNVNLKNSKFSFPRELSHPIQIVQLNNTTSWNVESNNVLVFSWKNSNLMTKDFNIISSGEFSDGEVNTVATVNHLNIQSIPTYLPKSQSTISEFIKASFLNGWLSDITLKVKGKINQLPFNHGGGLLQVSENFNDVTLKFSPNWGPITHIYGTLKTNNQLLNTKITSGNLGDFKASKSEYTVQDIFADNPILTMNGYASGKTIDYINYLKTTPINANLSQAPDQFLGTSEVYLKLTLPTAKPDKLKLNGYWQFNDNTLDFGKPILIVDNFNGKLNFNELGILKSSFNATALNSDLNLSVINQHEFEVDSPNLDYGLLFSHFNIKNIFSGSAATKVVYNVNEQLVSINSELNGVKIIAPYPLNKNESDSKSLDAKVNLTENKINLNFADTLYALILLNQNFHYKSAKIGLGTPDLNIKYNNNYPLTIHTKLKRIVVLDWVNFFKKFDADNSVSTTNNVNPPFYPMQIELNTDAVWLKNYNIDGGKIDMSIDSKKVIGQINMPDIYGQFFYNKSTNKVQVNLDKLLLSTSNISKTPVESTIKPEITPRGMGKPIPDIDFNVQNFYFQDHYLGQFKSLILQRGKAIYIESASVTNVAGKTIFRIIDHEVGESREYTELRARTQIKDYGLLISKLNIGDNLKSGVGVFDLSLKWRGGFTDFNIKKTLGYGTLNLKHGEFATINPGLFGSLLGVVSLNSFTNVNGISLNNFFGKGFAYDSWDMKVDVLFDQLKIEKLNLVSNAATINSFGTINLNDNTVDSYLTVQPRLGTAVATTAGIVTLNPFIGAFVYAGEAIIGNPINKALGLSYHITGKVSDPEIVKFNLSDQIQQNFLSTTNLLQHPASIFDVQVNK